MGGTTAATSIRCGVFIPFLLALLLGAPVWWQLTTVYRTDLPLDTMHYSGQRQWPRRRLTITLQAITVDTREPEAVSRLNTLREQLLKKDVIKKGPAQIDIRVKPQTVFGRGLDYFGDDIASLGQTDDHLYTEVVPEGGKKGKGSHDVQGRPGTLHIFLVLDGVREEFEDRIVAGQYRHWWMGKRVRAKDLASVLALTILRKQSKVEKEDEHTKTVPLAPRYHLCFSLLNEDPSLVLAKWDFARHAPAVLAPVVRTLRPVADLTITSQVINYARSTERPVWQEQFKMFQLGESKLKHFIRTNEWNLVATATSSDPTLHFVTYIPSAAVTPTVLVDTQGQPLAHNAFTSARWGGVRVHNVRLNMSARAGPDIDLPQGQQYVLGPYELHAALGVFVTQLRELLGVAPQFFDEDLMSMEQTSYKLLSPRGGVTLWELDVLLQRRLQESLAKTGKNLDSLATLIEKLKNMVVQDRIGAQVAASIDALEQATAALQHGDLVAAHEHAQLAWSKSEAAFFDRTMLSLLYFPEEHKLAMYVPLFAPIAVPILRNTVLFLKGLKARRQGAGIGSSGSSTSGTE